MTRPVPPTVHAGYAEAPYMDSRHTWPFPTIKRASERGLWTEVSQEHYESMLGAVPPQMYVANGFYVGENDHDGPDGHPCAALFVKHGVRYFGRIVRVSQSDAASAKAALWEILYTESKENDR